MKKTNIEIKRAIYPLESSVFYAKIPDVVRLFYPSKKVEGFREGKVPFNLLNSEEKLFILSRTLFFYHLSCLLESDDYGGIESIYHNGSEQTVFFTKIFVKYTFLDTLEYFYGFLSILKNGVLSEEKILPSPLKKLVEDFGVDYMLSVSYWINNGKTKEYQELVKINRVRNELCCVIELIDAGSVCIPVRVLEKEIDLYNKLTEFASLKDSLCDVDLEHKIVPLLPYSPLFSIFGNVLYDNGTEKKQYELIKMKFKEIPLLDVSCFYDSLQDKLRKRILASMSLLKNDCLGILHNSEDIAEFNFSKEDLYILANVQSIYLLNYHCIQEVFVRYIKSSSKIALINCEDQSLEDFVFLLVYAFFNKKHCAYFSECPLECSGLLKLLPKIIARDHFCIKGYFEQVALFQKELCFISLIYALFFIKDD